MRKIKTAFVGCGRISDHYKKLLITKKVKRAKTDPHLGLEFDNKERPEANNLLTIYSILSGLNREEVLAKCSDMGWGKFKPLLTEKSKTFLLSSINTVEVFLYLNFF